MPEISALPALPNDASPAGEPRIFGLDLLRAAAILSVLGAHAAGGLYPHLPRWFGLVGHGGFYGVELFFVLSGFLIGGLLLRSNSAIGQRRELARFYLRRWFRTLPLFWLFLFVNVAIELALRHHTLTVAEVLSHGFFLRSLTGNHFTFFAESWSLAIEEWFYLLFPVALWCGLKFSARFDAVFLSVAGLFFLGSTLLRLAGASQPFATWAEWQREVVFYRFDALMLGVFAAWIASRRTAQWERSRVTAACAGTVLLIAMYATLWNIDRGALAFGDDNFFARTFRFNLVSLGFALLLPFASTWRLISETLGAVCIRRIALWSYAIYLVHLPVIDLTKHFVAETWQSSGPCAFMLFAGQISLAILLSALIYRFYESPITRLRERFAPSPRASSRKK